MLPTNVLYLIMKKAIPDIVEEYGKNYETRLKTQKFVYLFDQIWGEDFYNHSWYLAGPYSSTLSHQIYDLLDLSKEYMPQWDKLSLAEDVIETIEKVNHLLSEARRSSDENLTDSQSYELVASIWYIAKKKKNIKNDEIKKELLLTKSHFKEVNSLDDIVVLVTEAMQRQ